MAIRSILAFAFGSSMAAALATDVAQPSIESGTVACPGLTANITLDDYEGQHVLMLCVAPQGLSISGGVVNLHVYDYLSDGIFHNGFQVAP